MRKLLADTSISNNPKILEELKKAGWKSTTAYRQEKGTRCYQFGVLYRFENSSILEHPNHTKCVTDTQVTHYSSGKTAKIRLWRRVQTRLWETHRPGLNPSILILHFLSARYLL